MQETKVGLLSVNETASYLGIQTTTLYSWVNQRKIPFVKVGRLVRFRQKDLDAWVEENLFETKN